MRAPYQCSAEAEAKTAIYLNTSLWRESEDNPLAGRRIKRRMCPLGLGTNRGARAHSMWTATMKTNLSEWKAGAGEECDASDVYYSRLTTLERFACPP